MSLEPLAPPVLTRDAYVALCWAALGRTADETATATGWDRSRVLAALDTARAELGARSKLEAVIIATRHGIL
jgi:DNA-binding CsgD family transcriptional regulator